MAIFHSSLSQWRREFEDSAGNGAEVVYYNIPSHPLSRTQRVTLLVIFLVVYVRTVVMFLRPVQVRILNSFSGVDLAIMAGLILPFIAAPLVRSFQRITRMAWVVAAVMALDVVFFAMMEFAPSGSGHPSLEALGTVYLGLAKLALIPITLLLLIISCLKGERINVIGLGFLCLIGATLYATYPSCAG